MTAASGVVHEEFHSRAFTRTGGTFEVVQLWVNLPAKVKMLPPKYHEILDGQIPAVPLDHEAGSVRVIAGEFHGTRGPARTFTPIHLWDLRLKAGRSADLAVPAGYTTALVVQKGAITLNNLERVGAVELVIFDRAGERIKIDSSEDTMALLLCGEPIDEPVIGQGPFVMNTQQEIAQAVRDYRSGKMGHLSSR
jgi:redox-sensitive bicupin YhaK (pirin superfamily)